MNSSEFSCLAGLMSSGEPVCIIFNDNKIVGSRSDKLFCELVLNARYGESFQISDQRCRVGSYILGADDHVPSEYYFKSGRYASRDIAQMAAESLPRKDTCAYPIKIEPLHANNGYFDVMVLYLTPEKAMKVVQAYSYYTGERVNINTIGAASVCADCTILPLQKGLAISVGCKGSRKHTGYSDHEMPVGISQSVAAKIEAGLSLIPKTSD
ncbi:protein of unknown function DUF169 [Methanosalsum zhilinae DSM 4017]|uniref:Protein clustered with O-phosphoseryl-tRNA(Cys) synthetase n=1 Tax=Methanosalsum zhilinae (strain DSM 4017 / NBRC 107636 / OCM 62 / WeN5) TaxID=679901 RepID=F7XL65_METZD|nr:DUF169 domain-containing protein [Methanosalsum zhilinae]AEH60122.1 protein of unknown function DUF169 [Methanosalsum zhilinae DSM 4017]